VGLDPDDARLPEPRLFLLGVAHQTASVPLSAQRTRCYALRSERATSPNPPNNNPNITMVLKSDVWRK
jgi:hypothetical protein